jgi:predicted DsbA family dithiol-disulfide isomerase
MDDDATDAGTGALVVYGDYTCALCYLLESLLQGLQPTGVSVERRGLEARPAPHPLPAPADEEMQRHWRAVVEPAARRLGVEVRGPQTWPRTRKAHELALFAREANRFPATHAALYRAFFVEGRDIGRIDVLTEIAAEAGLDAESAHIALGVDRYTEAVMRHAAAARQHGVDRLPTLVRGTERLVGLPSAEQLHAFVRGENGPHANGTR